MNDCTRLPFFGMPEKRLGGIMYYWIKTTYVHGFLLSLALISTAFAAPLNEECDGEKKTCCLVQDRSNIPPFWVNGDTCPTGTIDDATCTLQYGCTTVNAPSNSNVK